MKIITIPEPILNQKTSPVKKIDQKINQLIKKMIKTLDNQKNPPGVGLAAPQVGKSLSLFIIKPTKKSKPQVFINPKIIKTESQNLKFKNQNKKLVLEGCLSIPKIWGAVKRDKKVILEYQDALGNKKIEEFLGLKAVIIQHEMDHLNGILFTQRAVEQKADLYEEKNGKFKKLIF